MTSSVETRELTPDLWDDYVALFGAKGACGGCWCMSWRVAKGEKWDEIKGDAAKRRMEALVKAGEAHGILAYVDGEPVGWCSFGKRPDYAKLDRAPSLACDDATEVWSVPCFFVKAGHRGRGIAGELLAAAERALKARGGHTVEAYPAKPNKDGKPMPAAFAWTGPRQVFDRADFEVVGNPDGGKQRMRKGV